MVQTPVQGQTINEYVSKVGGYEGKEREEGVKILEHLFTKVGTAIAELHSSAINIYTEQSKTLELNQMTDEIADLLNTVEFSEQSLSIDNIIGDIKELYKDYYANPLARSYVHGDAHFDNFMFNSDSLEITLIDLPSLNESIDKQGCPIGTAASDYSRLLGDLEDYKGIFTKHEYTLLENSFKKAYEKAMTYRNPYEIKFHEVLRLERLINLYMGDTIILNVSKEERLVLLQTGVNKLHEVIQAYKK